MYKFLFFILFSDIISSLPMLIKGIEIIIISKKLFYSIFQRISESSIDIVSSELWIAQCNAKENYKNNGIYLILIAILSIFLGLITN